MDKLPVLRSTIRKDTSQQPSGSGQPAWQPNADPMDVDHDPFNEPDPDAESDTAGEGPAHTEDGSLPDAGATETTTDRDALTGGSLTAMTESLPSTKPQARRGGKAPAAVAAPAAAQPLRGKQLEEELARRLQAAKRKRHASPSDVRDASLPKQLKQRETDAAAATQDPTESEVMVEDTSYPFTKIQNPGRRLPCAIRVGKYASSAVIGDPFARNPGIQIDLAIDAGRYGKPNVGLTFKINKGSKTETVTQVESDRHTFTVGWEPGVKIDDQYMMNAFDAKCGDDLSGAGFPKTLQNLKPTQKKRDKLYCIKFMYSGTKSSFYDEDWAEGLQDGEKETLYKLFVEVDPEPTLIMIWFVNPFLRNEYLEKDCLFYLRDAVGKHLPPLHQYKDAEGNPQLALNFPAPIAIIGNGMYTNYKVDKKTGKLDETRPNFHNFSREIVWDSIKDFYVYHGVPIVREAQYTRGAIGGLATKTHYGFFQSAPYLKVAGHKVSPDKWITNSCFYLGVRITPDEKGIKDSVPDEGAQVRCSLVRPNQMLGRPALPEDIYTGHVVRRPKEWFVETKTDFCVCVTKPRNGNVPRRIYASAQSRPNDQLQPVKIEIKFNESPTKREIKAMNKFCDETYMPELLSEARQAFVSHPSKAPMTSINLSFGPAGHRDEFNRTKYMRYIVGLQEQGKANAKQIAVLRAALNMSRRLACIAGPPGTGKTRSLRQLVVGLCYLGHTSLVVAPSNVAVDNDATAVYHNIPDDLRETTKMLRLEVGGAEMQAMLTQEHYTDFSDLKDSDPAKYKKLKDATDSPAFANAIDQMMVEYATFQDEFERLEKMNKHVSDVKEIYHLMQKTRRLKSSNVPVGMTLGYRMWESMQDDRRQAEKLFQEKKGQYNPTQWAELMSGPNSISVDDFDSSRDYREALEHYVKKDGKLKPEEKRKFQVLRHKMVQRVLRETHILFTTCNNAGSEPLTTGSFEPTIICCDEAGQSTCAGLFISMTNFTKWEGVFLFGDERQLQPIMLAGSADEFGANAKLSPQNLLMQKGFPNIVRLDTQYRMPRAISSFPSRMFYNEQLKDDPSVDAPHANKDFMLKFTKYGLSIDGPDGEGSELAVINVKYGVSRRETNGKSLVNHASADSILQFLQVFIENKVPGGDLKVICYYRGQTRLLQAKIAETEWPAEVEDGMKLVEFSTVDAFQGKESDIVFLDFVSAKDKLFTQESPERVEEVEDTDIGNEDFVNQGTATAHIRDPYRLCVGLTRSKCGLLIFCQKALLEQSFKSRQSRIANSISLMIEDAVQRKLLFLDDTHQDSSEEGHKMRESWGEQAIAIARKQQEEKDLEFVRKMQSARREEVKKLNPKEKLELPVYKSTQRRTTRIIGSRVETDRADEHDYRMNVSYVKPSTKKGKAPEFKQVPVTFGKFPTAADKGKDVEMTDAATKKAKPPQMAPLGQLPKSQGKKSASKQGAGDKKKALDKEVMSETAAQSKLKKDSMANVADTSAVQPTEAEAPSESAAEAGQPAAEAATHDVAMEESEDVRPSAPQPSSIGGYEGQLPPSAHGSDRDEEGSVGRHVAEEEEEEEEEDLLFPDLKFDYEGQG